MEFGKPHRIFRSHRSRPGNRLPDSHQPIGQLPIRYTFFQQQMLRCFLRQCTSCFIINQHQFRRILVNREVFQFNGQRKFYQFTVLIHCTPFGIIYPGSHFQPLHIGISQGCRNQGNEQPGMIQKESKLLPSEWKSGTKRGQPQYSHHPDIKQYKRPCRKHSRKAKHICRMIGRELTDKSHHHRNARHP